MTPKTYNIKPITDQLKLRFSQLALVTDDLLNSDSADLHYLLAKRAGLLTISLYLPVSKVAAVLACLGQSVPENFSQFLDNCEFLIVDLDSIQDQGFWRFYVRNGEFNQEWADLAFPAAQLPAGDVQLDTLGFFFDPQSGAVTQYKYYWFDSTNFRELRQRFNSSGEFLNSQELTLTGLADQSIYSDFNIADIDFTDFMLKYHYSDLDQQYITITNDARLPNTVYAAQAGGGASIIINDSEPPPPELEST